MTALTGMAVLTKLGLKRDRIRIPAYVLGLSVLLWSMLASGAAETRAAVIESAKFFANTPAMRLFGLPSGDTVGATTLIRGYFLLGVLAALMSAFSVVRHTRQNEETGSAELVGAAVVGRHAGLAAAIAVSVVANVALAVAIGLAGMAAGQPAMGSFTAGIAVGGLGLMFVGIAAVTAQLSSTTRGANGLAAGALGVAFVVSGVGNMLGHVDAGGMAVTSSWLSWLSPMGWGQQMRPFGGDNLWPLGLFIVGFAVLVGVAGTLESRRDVGRSLLPERRGRAEASAGLLGSFGLAWRLQRGVLVGWAVGMLGFGAIFGAISDQIVDAGRQTAEWYARMGGTDVMTDAWQVAVTEMAGMAIAVYVVQVLLRMRAEEGDGRLEPLLAGSVSRSRWMMSYILNAGLGAAGLLLLFSVSMGLAAGGVLGDTPGVLRGLIEASLLQLPGAMLLGGAVVALIALVPRRAGALSWALAMLTVLLGPLFGAATLQLPQWVQNISPFTHIPKVPAAPLTAAPVVALIAIALTVGFVALLSFRHRNLALPT